jgi:hypothetical protein
MHTTEIRDRSMAVPDTYVIHHDGDPVGGECIIQRWVDEHYTATSPAARPEWEIRIPFNILAEFVGQQLIHKKISDIEQQSGLDVLGLEPHDAQRWIVAHEHLHDRLGLT